MNEASTTALRRLPLQSSPPSAVAKLRLQFMKASEPTGSNRVGEKRKLRAEIASVLLPDMGNVSEGK